MRKKLITMGLVSALGAGTSAWAVNLDTPTVTPPAVIAGDALLTTDSTAGTGANAGTTYYRVTNNASNIDVVAASGVGFSIADQLWVRYDVTNAAWDGDLTTAMLDLNGADNADSITQGGLDGESSVIFAYTVATTSLDQTENISLQVTNLGVVPDASVGVTMAIYEKLSDATNQTNAIVSKSGSVLSQVDGTSVTYTAANETAQVATLFTAFNAAGTDLVGNLGSVTVATNTATTNAVNPLTGAAHAVGDAVQTGDAASILSIAGDFSFGDWEVDDACDGGGTALTIAEAEDSATALVGTIVGGADNLCVTVDGEETINQAGPYGGSMVITPVASAANALATQTGDFGSIAHNGTTVEIPYLTTFEDYNQRLIIVNRGATDAEYSITFTPEGDTTATDGTAATGTVPAGESVQIRATDIVTLSGKTRTAATLVVVAPSANISVATNQVNLSDGSTDTVSLL